MADDGSPLEVSVTAEKPKMDETINVSEVTADSNSQVGVESTAQSSDGSDEESLELVEELIEKGSKAMEDSDFIKAVDSFSRALEIRVAHYGELAPECVKLYYKYGCALLNKAQVAELLGAVPMLKKESDEDESEMKNAAKGESTTKGSVSSNAELVDVVADDVSSKKNQNEEEADDSDGEDIPYADENESDLDLAWNMIDVARAIVEKDSGDTMEKVDILSALAEVAFEREDIQTSLSDYRKALSILERLVEPDNRQLAELNLRLCLFLELSSQPEEAISFCQKGISIYKSRVLRLTDEVESIVVPTTASSTSGSEPEVPLSSNASQVDNAATEKQSEIETLSRLLVELEQKLEDLERLASHPKFIVSDTEENATHDKAMGSAHSGGGFDSPTDSTAGVTHLGIVGRGVKRASTNSECADSNPTKKLAIDSSSQEKGDGSSA